MSAIETFETVLLERHGQVAVLTMNRPEKLNAMNGQMHLDIAAACKTVSKHDDIRVLIVTGAGRGFSSGEDIRDMQERNARMQDANSQAVRGIPPLPAITPLNLRHLEIPVIAAVNGPCAGAGFGMAYMSDLRIASERAEFLEIYLNRGLVPSSAPWYLSRMVGLGKAMQIMMLGEKVGAKEAKEIGLVNWVVPHEELMPRAMTLAEELAAKPPTTMRYAKHVMLRSLEHGLEDVLQEIAFVRTLARSTTQEGPEAGKRFFARKQAGADQ